MRVSRDKSKSVLPLWRFRLSSFGWQKAYVFFSLSASLSDLISLLCTGRLYFPLRCVRKVNILRISSKERDFSTAGTPRIILSLLSSLLHFITLSPRTPQHASFWDIHYPTYRFPQRPSPRER